MISAIKRDSLVGGRHVLACPVLSSCSARVPWLNSPKAYRAIIIGLFMAIASCRTHGPGVGMGTGGSDFSIHVKLQEDGKPSLSMRNNSRKSN